MGSGQAAMQRRTGSGGVPVKDTAPVNAGKVATVTVGELRTSFKAVQAKLAKGVRVQVTRRGEVVAEMQAPATAEIEEATEPRRLPDFMAQLKEIWGPEPWDIDTNAMVSEGRDRDFVP